MKLYRRRLLLTALAAPVTAHAQQMPAAGPRAWAQQIPTLRIGVLGGENEADRLGRFGDYQKLLETTFQVPVRLFMAADYAGVVQAFAARQVETSYMSPSAYAAAWMESDGNVEPLLVSAEADGSTSYVAVVYVRADSGITRLEELRGRSMAWSDPNSASGYLIPRAELRAAGIEPARFFSRTGFAGGHEQAIVAVLQRQFDAGATWTSGIGDREQGYSRGALNAVVAKGMVKMEDLRIIWTSRPIQNGPVVVRKDLPQAFKDDLIAFHLALPRTHPQIHRAIERGSSVGWLPTRHEAYQVFIDMRREEAAARRAR